MKNTFLIFSLFVSAICTSQNSKVDFGLYFGNDFENDSVIVYVNDRLSANNVQLRVRMYSPTNLMIEQNSSNIEVRPYKKPVQRHPRVEVKNSLLRITIHINTIVRSFNIDLNKGKYLYAEFQILPVGWGSVRFLKIDQIDIPPLII